MTEEKIGEVVKFFAKPQVAAIEITNGVLCIGDRIKIKGHTTEFEETVTSMQIENQPIEKAEPGQLIGVKVKERVRPKDIVYKIVE